MSEITMRGIFLKYYPNAIKDRGMDLNKNGKIEENEKIMLGSQWTKEDDFWAFLERNVGLIKADLKKDAIPAIVNTLTDSLKRSGSIEKDLGYWEGDDEDTERLINENIAYCNIALDEEIELRKTAIKVLGLLDAKEAYPDIVTYPNIVKRLESSKYYVRDAAIDVLVGLNAKEAIPDIVKRLESSKYYVRAAAIEALGKLNAKEAIPDIVKRLEDSDKHVREAAIKALVDLNAKEAIPEITKCLKDLNKLVQSAAKEALEKIR